MFGKWQEKGVPHKGWQCVNMEDLGEVAAVCEMCERQPIRYVHTMEHRDYPGGLDVGCVCAAKMENDYEAPRRRERALRNRAQRRKRWLTRKWRVSMKGNRVLKVDGVLMVIRREGFSYRGAVKKDGQWVSGRKRFQTPEELKLALFDWLYP